MALSSLTDKEDLDKKTKDELIKIILDLQRLIANRDYVYIDAVSRNGCHVGLPTIRRYP